ncbi:galactokinase [Fusobacterium sp. MFO224]|uniref:galactokinase n=1 Tax=Fusobacterium sp. MFO224 TaxID=3378070 RepID=UPI003851E209
MDIKNLMLKKFQELFGNSKNKEFYFTPGRVNLIGEHIDYNGGFVFPCALSFGTYAICRKRNDQNFNLFSINFPENKIISFNLEELKKTDVWGDYCKGVIKIIKDNNFDIPFGLDIVFYGNIPNGAGLSSSASLEVLMGTILNTTFNLNIPMIDIVKYSQKAENEFIGVSCGIMDQFAVGMGKKDHAILLNCNTLEYEYAPISLKDASIVIMNTNKRRGLADSKYNERRASCEDALKDLQNSGIKIKNLCDLSLEKFQEVKHFIKSEESLLRAIHAVSENERVLNSMKALEKSDIETFGKLMNESHISLRDNYEVTGFELDSIVKFAWEEVGTIGARMTGAGFGGCAVSIVKNDCIDDFIKNVGDKYKKATNLEADFYIANIGDGSKKLGDL